MKYFVQPPLVTLEGYNYCEGYRTYSEYNYLRPGIRSYFKKKHFETALKLTERYFYRCNVLDFGCADGIFLPSLSKYFNYVVGIDSDPIAIRIAHKLCKELSLKNVELICNEVLTIDDLKSRLSTERYDVLFLLETLEHVGDKDSLYESKIDFLERISTLIEDRGILVVSVPKMVGIPFLVQRLGLEMMKMQREPVSMIDLFKASFLNDTEDLEKRWCGGHLGFNHKKLERSLQKRFQFSKKEMFFNVMYVVGKEISSPTC